jgi:predicted  nucleic acid-binding Zn-ribbon protein
VGRCGCSIFKEEALGKRKEKDKTRRAKERARAQTLLNSETAQSEDESNDFHELSLQSLQLHQKYIDNIITIIILSQNEIRMGNNPHLVMICF